MNQVNGSFQQIFPFSMNQSIVFPYSSIQTVPKRSIFSEISIKVDLPICDYLPEKHVLIPFDIKMSNNGRFESIEDAISFISYHCSIHHQSMSRQLAWQYCKYCQIYSLVDCGYIQLSSIDKKHFNNALTRFIRKNL